jgi:thymidylate synthase
MDLILSFERKIEPMELICTKIDAIDIQDAWFQCIAAILDVGFKYEIHQGSFVGQTRLEFDHIVVHIRRPYSTPYDTMLPQIPAHFNIPNPVANGYVEQYLPYLMTDHIEPTEQYTYGSRIYPQIPYWIEVLKKTPNTNQAVLQVARHDDYMLEDTPCLRHIDMRIKDNTLIFYPYFRSWDLWGGFPANLAGIAVLQKTMADEIGVEAGPIVASSKGLHIYGYVEELAKLRTGK